MAGSNLLFPQGNLPSNLRALGDGTLGGAGPVTFHSPETLAQSGSKFAPGTTWSESADGKQGIIYSPDGNSATFPTSSPEYQAAKVALNAKAGQPLIGLSANAAGAQAPGQVGMGATTRDMVATNMATMPFAKAEAPPGVFGPPPAAPPAQGSYGVTQNFAPVQMRRVPRMPTPAIAPTGAELFGKAAVESYGDAPQGEWRGYGDEARGIQEQTAGELDDVAMRQRQDEEHARWSAQEAERYSSEVKGRLQQADDAYRVAIQRGVDPNRVFSNGTLSRTDTTIALILGGMAAGQDGENQNLTLLNKMLDRDLEAQKAELSHYGARAQNMLSHYQAALGDQRSAELAVHQNLLALQENRLKAGAQRFTGADAQQKARDIANQLAQKRVAIGIELQDSIHKASVESANMALARWKEDALNVHRADESNRKAASLNQLRVSLMEKGQWTPAMEFAMQSGDNKLMAKAFEGLSPENDPTTDPWNTMTGDQRGKAVKDFAEASSEAVAQRNKALELQEIFRAHPDTKERMSRFVAAHGAGFGSNDPARRAMELMIGQRLIVSKKNISGAISDRDMELIEKMFPQVGDSPELIQKHADEFLATGAESINMLKRAFSPGVIAAATRNAEANKGRKMADFSTVDDGLGKGDFQPFNPGAK